MRALLAVAVLALPALAAPTVASACGMVMREDSVNLAELMDDVDEAEKPEVALTAAEQVEEPEATSAEEPASNDATADAQPKKPQS